MNNKLFTKGRHVEGSKRIDQQTAYIHNKTVRSKGLITDTELQGMTQVSEIDINSESEIVKHYDLFTKCQQGKK